MPLQINIQKDQPDAATIGLTGELNSDTAAQCEKEIDALLTPAIKTLILDLRHLKYISSIGLRLVLKAQKFLKKNGGQLVLRKMTAPVAKVFEIASMLPPDVRATKLSEDIFLDAVQRRESVKKHDISE